MSRRMDMAHARTHIAAAEEWLSVLERDDPLHHDGYEHGQLHASIAIAIANVAAYEYMERVDKLEGRL